MRQAWPPVATLQKSMQGSSTATLTSSPLLLVDSIFGSSQLTARYQALLEKATFLIAQSVCEYVLSQSTSGRLLMHVNESSEPVAIYLLDGSIEMEFILLLCGLRIQEIISSVLEYIINTLELLSPPPQNSTDPDRSHSISVISFLLFYVHTGSARLLRFLRSQMLMMFYLVSSAKQGADVLQFQAIVSISGLLFFSVFIGLIVYRTSHSLRVSRFKLVRRCWLQNFIQFIEGSAPLASTINSSPAVGSNAHILSELSPVARRFPSIFQAAVEVFL